MVCGWMMGGWLVRWSKGDRWGAALTLVLAATACGGTVVESTDDTASAGSTGGADVPPDCVGAYAGNFDGDLRGRLTGNLHPDADFEVTFVQAGTNQGFTGSGSVDKDGKIEVVFGPNSVTGRFNFKRCRANGNWAAGEARGNWNATLH